MLTVALIAGHRCQPAHLSSGAPPPVTSGWYWALLGFDLAMRVRNAVWRPPFVMYYRTVRCTRSAAT